MAFEKKFETRRVELATFIDVVFLLLIFFLVTFAVSMPGPPSEDEGMRKKIFDLPEAKGSEAVVHDEVLENLLIQIEHKNEQNPASPKVAYVLWPDVEDSLTLSDAFNTAKEDSVFAEFPRNFLGLSPQEFERSSPCSLIAANIKAYKNQYFRRPSLANSIEIRAVRGTEFRIINFIMQQCSAYEDTIPKMIFRTLSEAEVDTSGVQ